MRIMSMSLLLLSGVCTSAAHACFDYRTAFQVPGRLGVMHADPAGLAVVGDAAYSIGADDAWLAIYDVSDHTHPRQVATMPLPAAPRALVGGSVGLLLAVPGVGLVHYSLADPFAPVARDTLNFGPTIVDVDLVGDLAAVGMHGGVTTLVTLAYPFGMVPLGSVRSTSGVTAVALDGDRLHVGTVGAGILNFDVGIPSAPASLGVFGFPGAVGKLDAHDGLLVATGLAPGGGWRAHAFVTADPPHLLATLSEPDEDAIAPTPRVTAADRVVLAASAGGAREYTIDEAGFAFTGLVPGEVVAAYLDPDRFVALTSDDLLTGSGGVFPPAPVVAAGAGSVMIERDGLIYTADDLALRVIDVRDPAAPTTIGNVAVPSIFGSGRAIALAGSVVYLGNPWAPVTLVDVQDPTSPTVVGSLPVSSASSLLVDGDILYVTSVTAVLTYDVTDPAAPRLLGSLPADIADPPHTVKQGDFLLLKGPTSGIEVYDVSDPTAPAYAGLLIGRNYISGLAVAGDRLLVADRTMPVQVWRWNDATRWWDETGEIPFARTLDIALAGDVGYVLHEFGNVAVLDLSGAGVPAIIGLHPTGDTRYASLLATRTLWLATNRANQNRIFPPACLDAPTAVEPQAVPIIDAPTLTVVPNPFNPRTAFDFEMPRAGYVTLRVHDLRGRLVTTLIDGVLGPGPQQVVWNGNDAAGRPLASGVYQARLVAAGQSTSRSVTLLR